MLAGPHACTHPATTHSPVRLRAADAPPELVAELSRRYVLLYETITGQRFEPPSAQLCSGAAMQAAVDQCLRQMS